MQEEQREWSAPPVPAQQAVVPLLSIIPHRHAAQVDFTRIIEAIVSCQASM